MGAELFHADRTDRQFCMHFLFFVTLAAKHCRILASWFDISWLAQIVRKPRCKLEVVSEWVSEYALDAAASRYGPVVVFVNTEINFKVVHSVHFGSCVTSILICSNIHLSILFSSFSLGWLLDKTAGKLGLSVGNLIGLVLTADRRRKTFSI